MSEKTTDVELVAALKKGDLGAFSEIVDRYTERVHNLAMRITRDEEDTEEIIQDVFFTVYKKISSFEGKSAFSSWLYRITANASFMKLRKKRPCHVVSLDDEFEKIAEDLPSTSEDPSFSMGRVQLRERLEDAIRLLPSDYRAIFVLRDIDRLSNKEVSDILGISVPALKSKLHRSRIFLRKKLQGWYHREVPAEELEDYDLPLVAKSV